jgi:selenide,water dikinase
LDDTRALVATTDFFTPIVDDPWTYGAIAATNAMSDVYAMGGEVLFCLNLAGFPEDLEHEVIAQIFAGGAAKVREAGAVITGGHTITNPEPVYGLSVTGLVHPTRGLCKGGMQTGDIVYLTKPLGTGVITTAAKMTGAGESLARRAIRRGLGKPDLDPAHLAGAVQSMLLLNRAASQAAQAAQASGATDITGFGLLGHAAEMARAAAHRGVGLVIHAESVPVLAGVWDYLAAGYVTRGSSRNPEAFGEWVTFDPGVGLARRTALWEAETSSGLLVTIPAGNANQFVDVCSENNQDCWRIGHVEAGTGIRVE